MNPSHWVMKGKRGIVLPTLYRVFQIFELTLTNLNLGSNMAVSRKACLFSITRIFAQFSSVLGTNSWCSPDELQILVPLINQSQAEKVTGLEDLTKVYLDRVLDYMITQVRMEKVEKPNLFSPELIDSPKWVSYFHFPA